MVHKLFRSLVAFCAVLLHARALLADSTAPSRLGSDVVPTAQEVRLHLDPAQADYRGEVRIALLVHRPVRAFRFHAEEMTLGRMELAGKAGPITLTHARDGALVTVTTAAPLAPGAYTLSIDFNNRFGTRAVGLYRMTQEGQAYAFTQFESADARKAFPCWDEPGFKIPYQLTLEVPEALRAVTNTPLASESTQAGWQKLVFQRTRPLPSYLLAIAVGPLDERPIAGLGVPGRVIAPRAQAHLGAVAAELAPPILHALEQYFGSRYPYEKLDLIAVPEYWPGAMEHPGAVTFADNILLLDGKTLTARERATLALVLAHELAHMWFGDLVTMAWWDDLWLNESFADWMAYKIADSLYPQYHFRLEEVQGNQDIMVQDARPATEPIRRRDARPETALNHVGLDYQKGRAVLGMFERWIGPERFRQGVKDYLHAHAFGNATAADLWTALSRAAGQDVAPAMATFLDQPGVPLITVISQHGGRLLLSQRRFAPSGVPVPGQLWRVPLALKFSDGQGVHARTVMLSAATQQVDLSQKGELAWVMPQAQATGYYRWALEPDRLLALAQGATQRLEPAERIVFLSNLAALLAGGLLHGDEYLRLLAPFAEDPDPQVIAGLAGALHDVERAFVSGAGEPLAGRYRAYVRRVLAPARRRFGLLTQPGEDARVALLRPQLITGLGDEGDDPEVVRFAQATARRYLADPAAVDAATAGAVLWVAAVHGDRHLFDEYRRHFEAAQVPAERRQYLSALGAFRGPALKEALRYALAGPVRPNELAVLTESAIRTEEGRARTYEWLTHNFATIAARIPPQFVSMLPQLAGGCEEQRLAAARQFFSDSSHQADGTTHEVERMAQQVQECVALRRREGEAVARFLAGPS